jgi:immune inhibitor A
VPGPAVGQTLKGTATQYGATYYRVQTSGPSTLMFEGSPSMQLIGANPHGAPFEWWSNRGDSIDSRLTRPVDLHGVKSATLHFWIWYDIEKDFDYGYVEVSSDGGKTWRTLPASDTTTSNPNGQNYGNGFTGASGGDNPRWVPEAVDLTPYAGRQILIRFEYVTDDSYNADGFAIDDVEIPEIGFKDTAASDHGWHADGFVRIDNRWPEKYLVEVLSPSGSPPVQTMQLDASQHGSMKIAAGQTVTVAVAGLAPITTHTTTFELGLRPG